LSRPLIAHQISKNSAGREDLIGTNQRMHACCQGHFQCAWSRQQKQQNKFQRGILRARRIAFVRLVVDDCGLRGFGGSGSGLCHAPPKTPYYRNLCGCGVIFVVRDSSNPEMGVEVKPSPCKSSSSTTTFCCFAALLIALLCCHYNARVQCCCNGRARWHCGEGTRKASP